MSAPNAPPQQPKQTDSMLSSTKHASPPRTPPRTPPNFDAGTPSSDSSFIPPDLSFDFTFDADGQYVRLPKSAYSSPPTPQDDDAEAQNEHSKDDLPPRTTRKPASPDVPAARANASRAENLGGSERPSLMLGASSRQAQRVPPSQASSTPATSSSAGPLRQASTIAALSSRGNDRPQRVTLEEFHEREERNRKQVEEMRAQDEERRRARLEERENKASDEENVFASGQRHASAIEPPPLATSRSFGGSIASSSSLSSARGPRSQSNMGITSSSNKRQPAEFGLGSSIYQQREREWDNASLRPIMPGPNRAGRVLKSSAAGKYGSSAITSAWDHVPAVEAEDDHDYGYGAYQNQQDDGESVLDDVDPGVDDHYQPVSSGYRAKHRPQTGLSSLQQGHSRPRRSASFGDASIQEDRVSSSSAYPVPLNKQRPVTSLGLHSHRGASDEDESSPPRGSWEDKTRGQRETAVQERYRRDYQAVDRRQQGEKSRQSPSPTQGSRHQRSTAHGLKRHDSETARGAHHHTPPSTPPPVEAVPARLSPSAKHVSSASTLVNGTSLNASRNKHRRSPTAPELGGTSGTLAASQSGRGKNKAWTAPEERLEGVKVGGERGAAQSLPLRTSRTAPTAPSIRDTKNQLVVNKKAFIRLDVLGKGGSSRVYRVMNAANEIFAIKRVSLEKTDTETMSGYMNEIALLKRLDGNQRIIRLYDSELKPGTGGTKGHLLLLMECGEIDMAKLLLEQQKEAMNMVWISYYWQQMLQAVHVIHEEKIVHSDLKPANFVLVRGQLKLIDFGIANAIANDTTNIQRESAIGTVNYMSPETIELPDGMRRLKVGRPSDVWSLGCILYQMVYGQTPFHHLSFYQKMKAIPDSNHNIEFPTHSTPSLPPPQGSTTPQKLDHLARPVRVDVIECMKSCLRRSPKERSTIPELLEQQWLVLDQREPAPSEVPAGRAARGSKIIKELLKPDETIINHHYMAQLLDYGMRIGLERGCRMSAEELKTSAEKLVEELQKIGP